MALSDKTREERRRVEGIALRLYSYDDDRVENDPSWRGARSYVKAPYRARAREIIAEEELQSS